MGAKVGRRFLGSFVSDIYNTALLTRKKIWRIVTLGD